jgi:hypothetical protein
LAELDVQCVAHCPHAETDSDDDASSVASSVNDLPADREVDRAIATRQQSQLAPATEPQQAAGRAINLQAIAVEQPGAPPPPQPPQQPQQQRKPARVVHWAQDAEGPANGPRQPRFSQRGKASEAGGEADLAGIDLPAPAERQAQREAHEQSAAEQGMAAPPKGTAARAAGSATSLPLTEDNVALLEQKAPAQPSGTGARPKEV